MTNTCTVDNVLYCLHNLQCERDDIRIKFMNSSDPVLKRLYEIHVLFKDGQFDVGKQRWLEQFFQASIPSWDAHGSEYTFMFSKLDNHIMTVFTNQCSSVSCPDPVKMVVTKEFCVFM